MNSGERRAGYRVHYPVHLRPGLMIRGALSRVMDISETGICFQPVAGLSFLPGEHIRGQVVLGDHQKIDVAGTIVRLRGTEVAAALGNGFSFENILRQRDLVQSTDLASDACHAHP